MILRNLGKELRDGLLNSINEKDSRASDMIAELMIIWEDIPQITDRSLAEAIRRIDAGKLALALVGADNALIQKIKSNISERAAAAVDEETSLMSTPMREDIKKARDEIVQVLRKANSKDGLAFIEE